MRVQSLSGEDSLEEEMATHSRIFAWRIPEVLVWGGLLTGRVHGSHVTDIRLEM